MVAICKRLLFTAIICAAATLPVNRAYAQSVAIQFDATNRPSLEATGELGTGYRLQISDDLGNWTDIGDQASGALKYRLDTSTNSFGFYRLRTWPIDETPITLAIIGDSTVADFSSNAENFYGWGQGLHDDMKGHVLVINLAMPVHSTKNFLTSIQRAQLETIKPDFVLIQFGLVDTADSPLLGTTLLEYESNLKTIVTMVRGFNGTPVLVTPTITRYFDETGKVRPYLSDRSEVVRRVATDLQTYLIDLNQKMTDLYNSLGESGSDHITWNGPSVDRTHFSEAGAEIIADVVVESFPQILKVQVAE